MPYHEVDEAQPFVPVEELKLRREKKPPRPKKLFVVTEGELCNHRCSHLRRFYFNIPDSSKRSYWGWGSLMFKGGVCLKYSRILWTKDGCLQPQVNWKALIKNRCCDRYHPVEKFKRCACCIEENGYFDYEV